jgi:hypothetical protein
LDARQKAYTSDMKLVQQAIAQNDVGRAQELLNRHRPMVQVQDKGNGGGSGHR